MKNKKLIYFLNRNNKGMEFVQSLILIIIALAFIALFIIFKTKFNTIPDAFLKSLL